MALTKAPEILAPVGNWEMCQAAVHNGADAVYLGMPYFNARGRTKDFTVEELKVMVDFCHLYGVKVFLACNVLVFEREIDEIEEILREVLPLGIDALIVQDIGLVRLINKICPSQVVHASTQMTVTNNEAILLTSDLNIQRYVLAREVSIPEMEKIRKATTKELEVFVHGALCVSYSGQCLTSESHGGRSANRGQCAQSCRLDYKLVVDGVEKDLGEKRYLVSPQDLCGLEDVRKLVDLGIDSFKIEGRLKSPAYVASTVRNYREVRDGEPISNFTNRIQELSLTFSRGHFNGWMNGVNHQSLVDARFSRPTGVFLGELNGVEAGLAQVRTVASLQPGDGVVFYDFDSQMEVGGIVFAATPQHRGILALRFDRAFDTRKLKRGMEVYHNSSSNRDKELRSSYEDKAKWKKISVEGTLSGSVGEKPTFILQDQDGRTVTAVGSAVLEKAKSSALTQKDAASELGSLGGTPFSLDSFQFAIRDSVFLHNRGLKELRREATEKLIAARLDRLAINFVEVSEASEWRKQIYSNVSSHSYSDPQLHVLIRSADQLEALKDLRIGTVYLDYEFNKDYEKSLVWVREHGFKCGIATTRILKPGELGHLKYIERLRPDVVLVRNLGALHYFRERQIGIVGDFSLNVSNGLTASWFLEKGAYRLCPSYDLNQTQLFDLLNAFPANTFEITVHQYMPAFHMEHCVFAAFLSNGTSYRDCGRPCEKYRVELKDKDGVMHPLKADAECRNTMFQGKPQAAARLIPQLLSAGVPNFRLEALFETAGELRLKIDAYCKVICEGADPLTVFDRLGIVERYGVTEGQLFNDRVYRDKKKESLQVLQ